MCCPCRTQPFGQIVVADAKRRGLRSKLWGIRPARLGRECARFGGLPRSIPNQSWFWWTLFISDLSLTYILAGLSIKEFVPIWLEEILVFLAISQFIVIMFWTPKVVTRVELYGHWRGKKIAEKLKRETAAHQELDRLREAMIFGEAEGDAYWSVIQQLEPVKNSNYD